MRQTQACSPMLTRTVGQSAANDCAFGLTVSRGTQQRLWRVMLSVTVFTVAFVFHTRSLPLQLLHSSAVTLMNLVQTLLDADVMQAVGCGTKRTNWLCCVLTLKNIFLGCDSERHPV